MHANTATAHNPASESVPNPYASGAALAAMFVGRQRRHTMIAEAAYFRALRRGFAPGHELDDWLAAEAQIDAELIVGVPQ